MPAETDTLVFNSDGGQEWLALFKRNGGGGGGGSGGEDRPILFSRNAGEKECSCSHMQL